MTTLRKKDGRDEMEEEREKGSLKLGVGSDNRKKERKRERKKEREREKERKKERKIDRKIDRQRSDRKT